MDVKQRILWVDVAKCFGIFAIYLGHYRYSTGNAFLPTMCRCFSCFPAAWNP